MTTVTDDIHRISLVRVAASAGVANAVIFILCWLGTFLPFSSPTHGYIGLYTPAETQSVTALVEGGIWALLFGFIVGAVFALAYNMFAGLARRG